MLKQVSAVPLPRALWPGFSPTHSGHQSPHLFRVGTGPDAPLGSFRSRLSAPLESGVLTGSTTSQRETLHHLPGPAGTAGARVLSCGQCPACPSDGLQSNPESSPLAAMHKASRVSPASCGVRGWPAHPPGWQRKKSLVSDCPRRRTADRASGG